MLSILALISPVGPASFTQTWYGPETVTFSAPVIGNPYDPAANDAWVEFRWTTGYTERRLAYADHNQWKSVLVATHPGHYVATLSINGRAVGGSKPLDLVKTLPDGFVRTGGEWGFRMDSGKLYWPMGHNLGWQSAGLPDIPKFLQTMGTAGMNWSRIWSCAWDGKNPWWPSDKTSLPIGELWPKALDRWDAIVSAAQSAGIHFQFVLFHHGQWSSTTDPNWPDNPWNVKNGGFLSNPADFFSNPRAKELSKRWLRYAIARWAYSPSIMAWELFNEVQWVDAVKQGRQVEVGAWHDEMARYVRSLDPYDHLVTSSSELSLPIWKELDYFQPHGYPARIEPMVLNQKSPDAKPLFFGEVGPGQLDGSKPVQIQAVRDGIWSGLFAHHAGAAEYWTWDLALRDDLHREYAMARKLLTASGVLHEVGLRPLQVDLGVAMGADLKFAPGAGWEATRQFEFNLPQDAALGMGRLSAYFQGRAHPELRREPVTFRFSAPRAGTMEVTVTGVSGTGGDLDVSLNGSQVLRRSWPGGAKFPKGDVLKVPFVAGRNVVQLDNTGADWVQLGPIVIPGIAPTASALGIGDLRMAILRIERPAGAATAKVRLRHLPLADGTYRGVLMDLGTGTGTPVGLTVKGGQAATTLEVDSLDSILWLRRNRQEGN